MATVAKLDLSNERDYFLASAIRGPDNEHGLLKTMTTAVIRHKLGMGVDGCTFWGTHGAQVCTTVTAKACWAEATPCARSACRAALTPHFRDHASVAIRYLDPDYLDWLRVEGIL